MTETTVLVRSDSSYIFQYKTIVGGSRLDPVDAAQQAKRLKVRTNIWAKTTGINIYDKECSNVNENDAIEFLQEVTEPEGQIAAVWIKDRGWMFGGWGYVAPNDDHSFEVQTI